MLCGAAAMPSSCAVEWHYETYAEDACISRKPHSLRKAVQRQERPNRLIDVQNNVKAQQSAGYRHWVSVENLKRSADTLNFLTEHSIGSYEELIERCDAATAATARIKADIRATDTAIERLTLTAKYAATYRQLRPVYDQYRQSRDKEKFLRGHESEIILFEAAARELKRLDAVPVPATKRLHAELDELNTRRNALRAEHKKAQQDEKVYDTLRKNVEDLLDKDLPTKPEKQQKNELE